MAGLMKSVPPLSGSPAPLGPLGVCLPDGMGDVVQALPALRLLAQRGHSLHLMGPRWAADLLAGEDWACHALPAGWRDASGVWRELREQLGAPRGALPALVMRGGLSGAAAMRLGGWSGHGYAGEGRAWLLHRAWPELEGQPHTVERLWHLACMTLGEDLPTPPRLGWQVGPPAAQAAAGLLAAHGLTQRPFVVLCPFDADVEPLLNWPHFAALAREWAPELAEQGVGLVVCAGHGAADAARRDYPTALVIEGAGQATCAALLAQAELVVSGDGGLGHLAAAVGTPLLSVLGPGEATCGAPWGPSVQVLRRWPDWLEVAPVLVAARQRLAQRLALA